jgi:hypothetical protein
MVDRHLAQTPEINSMKITRILLGPLVIAAVAMAPGICRALLADEPAKESKVANSTEATNDLPPSNESIA